ncbi:hypothetical protein VKT23_013334 [Stygiomarasmius scandens]|uniref:N-acetyltransferase domain-containing protein n=1 Tax=Marasmiellus scandens TaxID=2682957 RepID=A0ABR1J331_9AGAR
MNHSTSQSKAKPNFTLREITEEELDKVCWIVSKEFLDDPIASFCFEFEEYPKTRSSSEGMQIHHLFSCVAKSCFYSGGRIVVATTSEPPATQGHRPSTPPPSDSARQKGEEVIAAVACWEPPNRRMNPWNILSIIRSGALKVLKGSGVGAVMRVLNYMSLSEKTHQRAFENSNTTPKDAWYLALAMTAKEYQGQGCLSLLVREAYSHARTVSPNKVVPFILESSTPRSRDRYIHLGFEVENQPKTILGKRECDSRGLKPSAKMVSRLEGNSDGDAEGEHTGVEYWCMVNWNPQVQA